MDCPIRGKLFRRNLPDRDGKVGKLLGKAGKENWNAKQIAQS